MSREVMARRPPSMLALVVVATLLLSMGASTKTKVVYWQHVAHARVEAVNYLKQEFEKQNLDIEIIFEPLEWGAFFDKIVTALATESGPDVFQMSVGEAERYIRSGLLQPIPWAVLTPEEARQTYLPWTVERLIYDGYVWGLPTDIQSIMLFCNDELFAQAGLPDRAPESWSDTIRIAQRLTRRDADGTKTQAGANLCCYSVALEDAFFKAQVPPMFNESGEAIFNSPSAVKALRYLTDFVVTYDTQGLSWVSGQVGMVNGHPTAMGDWQRIYPDLSFRAVLGPPVEPGGPQTTAGTHWEYFIAKKAPLDAAVKWIMFLASREGQRAFHTIGGDLVARWDLMRDPRLQEDPNGMAALTSLLHAQPISWRGWTRPVQLYEGAMQNVISGQMSPEASIQWLVEQMNAYLAAP